MWDFEMYRVLTAERLRETAREVARVRLVRAAEEGRRGNGARSDSADAGLGEAAPWWAVLRVFRLRSRPPVASLPPRERSEASASYGQRNRHTAVPRGNPDGCADQA